MSASKDQRFNDVLDACLERMSRGAGIDDCLASHPADADRLRPLLEVCQAIGPASSAGPTAEGRAAGRRRLREALAVREAGSRQRVPVLLRSWKLWTAAVASFVLVAGSYSVVQASSDTLPNDTLYPVKRTVERARLAWPMTSDTTKARLRQDFANRRADELLKLAPRESEVGLKAHSAVLARSLDGVVADSFRLAQRDEQHVQAYLQRAAIERRSALAEQDLRFVATQRLEELRERMGRDRREHVQRLQAQLTQISGDKKPAVEHTLASMDSLYQQAMSRIDGKVEEMQQTRPDMRLWRQDGASRQARQPVAMEQVLYGMTYDRPSLAVPRGHLSKHEDVEPVKPAGAAPDRRTDSRPSIGGAATP
ncbi:MAG: hypothetical protein HY261_06375 [Chloroflexi bacterium]|nr:hypothetical protein [Chloroflexota bacterium]